MEREIGTFDEVVDVLNDVLHQVEELKAENILGHVFINHIVAVFIRREKDPTLALEVLRQASNRNLYETLVWARGEEATNERLRAKALEKHEQFFEEMKRALGQRDRRPH